MGAVLNGVQAPSELAARKGRDMNHCPIPAFAGNNSSRSTTFNRRRQDLARAEAPDAGLIRFLRPSRSKLQPCTPPACALRLDYDFRAEALKILRTVFDAPQTDSESPLVREIEQQRLKIPQYGLCGRRPSFR